MIQPLVGDDDGDLLVGAVAGELEVGEVDRAIVRTGRLPIAVQPGDISITSEAFRLPASRKAVNASIRRMRSQLRLA